MAAGAASHHGAELRWQSGRLQPCHSRSRSTAGLAKLLRSQPTRDWGKVFFFLIRSRYSLH
eukprot:3133294-Amphidinium_carterae.1